MTERTDLEETAQEGVRIDRAEVGIDRAEVVIDRIEMGIDRTEVGTDLERVGTDPALLADGVETRVGTDPGLLADGLEIRVGTDPGLLAYGLEIRGMRKERVPGERGERDRIKRKKGENYSEVMEYVIEIRRPTFCICEK